MPALLQVIAALLADAPELISDVEALIASIKGAPAPGPLTPDVQAALDPAKAKLDAAARASG